MGAKDMEEGKGLPKPVLAGIVVAIVVVVAVVVMSGRQKFELVVPGTKAIDFTLPDLSGSQKSLSDYRGKVVFLNFWATWCKPCEEEMPSMQYLYTMLKGQPFEILAVSIDTSDASEVKAFTDKYRLTFPILHDRKGRVKETYKTTGVPETLVIDQNGVVAERVLGPRDWSDDAYLATIQDLLKNGPRDPESYKARK